MITRKQVLIGIAILVAIGLVATLVILLTKPGAGGGGGGGGGGPPGPTPSGPVPVGSGMALSSPEMYWGAGNQFPCDGSAGTYNYRTPPCTNLSIHKVFKNNPKAYWDFMIGNEQIGGSGKKGSGKSGLNPWFAKGELFLTVNKGNNQDIWPGFSLENLSTCTGDMIFENSKWKCKKDGDDPSDCLALKYYGDGKAPIKICGTFDGFSYWSWEGFKAWCAYYSYKTGSKTIVIYEAQFIPQSWFTDLGIDLVSPEPGTKSDSMSISTCTSNAECGQGYTCKSGVCSNNCLEKTIKCNSDANCPTTDCPPGTTVTCRPDNKTCKYTDPVENYIREDYSGGDYSGGGPLYCAFSKGTSDCVKPTAADYGNLKSFITKNVNYNASWDFNKNLITGTKEGAAAVCPYGMYYDKDKNDCVDQPITCGSGTTAKRGVCIGNAIGEGDAPKCTNSCDSNGEECVCVMTEDGPKNLPVPTMMLNWLALVGKAISDEDTCLNYTKSIIKFSVAAKIKSLTFPWITPPDKNNTPWLDDAPGTPKGETMINWIHDNFMVPCSNNKIEPAIYTYASSKDGGWYAWFNDLKQDAGHAGCLSSSDRETCNWPVIFNLLCRMNSLAKKNNTTPIKDVYIDKEFCSCGDLGCIAASASKYRFRLITPTWIGTDPLKSDAKCKYLPESTDCK